MKAARIRRRASFARTLHGEGLEIGALSDPLPLPHATRIVYSDWLPAAALERMYPGSKLPDIVSDSESFPTVPDESFDFIVANHVLEHVTDPIRALAEWWRILKPSGLLMLALPDKRFTFDAPRRRTTLEHLRADHASDEPAALRNRVHLEDWGEHVEGLRRGSLEYDRWIDEQLAAGYAVHNHVWIPRDIVALIAWVARTAPLRIERVANTSPLTNEFIFLLRRVSPGAMREPWGLRCRLAISDPLLSAAAALKRALLRRTRVAT
jgi:SAM-dependent methyltransferase